MNIALFGTSADPPTIGHAAILKYLTAHFDHVAVWAADNPFKPQQTSLAQRHHMLRLLVEDQQIDTQLLQIHPELSYPRTWMTLEKAQQIWPNAQFTLVVGADLVRQIMHWYRAADLLQAVRLLVIPRQGYELYEADLQAIRALGTPITIAHITPPKASSSEYRKQGQRSLPYLTPNIQAYIEREQLYAWQVDIPKKAVVQS
jgi:nicotinate-nucleotide adenylyltransferase